MRQQDPIPAQQYLDEVLDQKIKVFVEPWPGGGVQMAGSHNLSRKLVLEEKQARALIASLERALAEAKEVSTMPAATGQES